ncbi:uncharacterized protein BKA55DRAFT_586636 [Fusarium redolens]|uniref:Uncharacterized protein n=1 Tax=Fusarium redolens TaxID=48865 RepID=A0A9P9FX39_FUSRE|nr:uncharacterized protein BKA55DRAFT_586636 [Fusarium redolens]KAH7205794.1 hypothetical protein BKA55DRAFT_586636 [Fusarium redolens]
MLRVCCDLGHKSDIYHIMVKAWPGSNGTAFVLDWRLNSIAKVTESNFSQRMIIEMQKFTAVLRQEEADDYNAKQLQHIPKVGRI